MKQILRSLGIACLVLNATFASAQCSGAYTQVSLNWDNLDYFVYSGNYSASYLTNVSQAQTQNFGFGTQRLTITTNHAAANILGENTTNTGETGSYGTGADVQYMGDGTITLTFDVEVVNLKFSLYDIDRSQRVVFGATNALSVPQLITLSKISGSIVSFTNNGLINARVDATTSTAANSSTDGTVNVDIAGPVKTITLTISNTGTNGSEDGSFWLSDITACSTGSFAANYYSLSKPFTGQKSYVLHSFDKSVYAIDPSTGVTRLLFTDASGPGNINSMGYDPVRRILYYVYSLTATPGTNKALKKYDFNSKSYGTVLSDITSTVYGTGVNIPVTTYAGVESGAAGFYDGALYLGIETSNAGRNSNREAVIWRIDFDGTNVPYRASQVFGTPSDDGVNTLLHDWSDFAVNNGVLYDYDGAGVTTQTNVYHVNLITGATTNYALPPFTPGQIAIGWDNTIYQMYATTVAPAVSPYIAMYDNAGNIGVKTAITSTPMYTPAIPSLGDAAEGFRYPCDFGDAPSSYDPSGSDPAVHEITANLSLGTNKDEEMITRGQTSAANSDNYDDAIPGTMAPTFNPAMDVYLIQIPVFNNTGANATICAWLDYNGNGIFDPSEGITVSVASSATTQYKYLYWPAAISSLPNGTYTYLRIRITSTTNGMTTNNPTGYFSNGEVEDYRVPVNSYALSTKILTFDAEKSNGSAVNLTWDAIEEEANTTYHLQRSASQSNWTEINETKGLQGKNNYTYFDHSPLNGRSYYRLKIVNADGTTAYSDVRKIDFDSPLTILLAPNPTAGDANLAINSDHDIEGRLMIVDMSGKLLFAKQIQMKKGSSNLSLPTGGLPNGTYQVVLQTATNNYDEKLMIKR